MTLSGGLVCHRPTALGVGAVWHCSDWLLWMWGGIAVVSVGQRGWLAGSGAL